MVGVYSGLEYVAGALVCIFILLLPCYVRRWMFEAKYKLPPGPWCWPVVGFLPFPNQRAHLVLRKLAKKYGGVFGMYVGSRYVVVLDDFQAVKDCFNREAFLDRPSSSTQLSEEQPSIIDMSGRGWREQRKFQINSFRLLGTHGHQFEQFILYNAMEMISQLKTKVGRDIKTHHAVEFALNNITFRLLYGKSFEPDHPLIRQLTVYGQAVVEVFGMQTLTVFQPWLSLIYDRTSKISQAKKVITKMDHLIEMEIEDHRRTLVEDDPRDYIDHYLIEMKKPDCDPSYSSQNLIGNLKILLEASNETTNLTLTWFLLCMAEYQDIQTAVYQEISSVLGNESDPRYSDRKKMPFTVATIQESMRWKNLIHLSVFRQCSQDSKLWDYDIPKGTILIHNMCSQFHNAKYWPNPEAFNPYRFLSKDGTTVETPEYFIPFSYGPRMCPGDKLAKITMFIFTVVILQKFHVHPPKGGVTFEDNPIFNSYPVRPYVRLELRNT